jgi:hypothetical protein
MAFANTNPVTAVYARLLLAAAALPTAISLVYEWTTGAVPSNAVRAIAGAPLGAGAMLIVIGGLAALPRGRRNVN